MRRLGRRAHVGGGSHGSLFAGDSLSPLLHGGSRAGAGEPEQWTLRDVAPLVLDHFGVGARLGGAQPRTRSRRPRGDARTRPRRRIARGTRARRANWLQLFKFGLVGASGYVVNLIVFAPSPRPSTSTTSSAAVGAFCVAVTNNFLWNRHWTFQATEGHAGFQAMRFFAVSVGGARRST